MVTEVVITVWIRLVQGSEKMKDQDVNEAHGKSEGVLVYPKYVGKITFVLAYSLPQ